MTVPGMCYAAVVRSTRAHARLVDVDTSAASRIPGVVAVVTGADLSGLPEQRYGHAFRDHPVLALEKVRYVGEPVAAVVAMDERTAQLAREHVQVTYEALPYATDTGDAMKPDAAPIHERDYPSGTFSGITDRSAGPFAASSNICHSKELAWGDVEEGFRLATHVVEQTYEFPMVYAFAMEPYVAIADYSTDGLTVYSCAQHPFAVRRDLANLFDLPLSAVRLVVPYIGGGFGSKSYTKIEPLTSVLAWRARRPVKLALTVDEAILTTRVASARVRLRTGASSEGRLVAREATIVTNGGAYAENSPHGAELSTRHVIAPYVIPNVRVNSALVYTNTAPASSFRGFSSTQVAFASESQMDELADLVGMDRVMFRMINAAHRGTEVIPSLRSLDGDVPSNIKFAHEEFQSRLRDAPSREYDDGCTGVGLGLMLLGAGAQPTSTSRVTVHADDSVTVATGTSEMGQGSETVLAQIAAEELGVPYDRVRVQRADTALAPFDRSTGASRSTTLQGRALIEACKDVRTRLMAMATAVADGSQVEEVCDLGGVVIAGEFHTWGQLLHRYFEIGDCEAVGGGHVRRAGDLEQLPVFWESSIVAVRVVVDRDTGAVRVSDLSAVADVGKAINPAMVEGQDLGAAVQGLGPALFEELTYDGEELANGSPLLYRIPRFKDVPERMSSSLIENGDGVGPYGAKGAGEGAISATAPALASAVSAAIGKERIRRLPLTPERVWRSMQGLDDYVST
ncbi:MAG: molybdopterin-dependent oxidoreductase [Streptosporangiales bacterium]|nr:molybdopterin-dependent oxidoreductase [Streptosporangiales bacterium]